MGRLARQLELGAYLAAFTVLLGACYPTFRFDGGGDGGAAAAGVTSGASGSSSTGVRPTGTGATSSGVASGSSGAGPTGVSATSAVASGAVSSATSGGGVGAPCDVPETMACTGGQACCFELTSSPTDLCVDVCETDQDGVIGVDHLSLACNDDGDCGGDVCCVYYTFLGNLKGTWCQSSCTVDEEHACNPAQGCGGGTCDPLLYDVYGGQPPAPYDAYGICL